MATAVPFGEVLFGKFRKERRPGSRKWWDPHMPVTQDPFGRYFHFFVELMGNRTTMLYHVSCIMYHVSCIMYHRNHLAESPIRRLMGELGGLLF